MKASELQNKKRITKTTFKSFIRKNEGNVYHRVRSSFDGMTDMVEPVKDEFSLITKTEENLNNTCGVVGVWLVGRDSFSFYEDEKYFGIKYYNCTGSGIIAVPKEETTEEEPELTIENISQAIKDYCPSNGEAKNIVWAAANKGYIRTISATQAEWTEEGLEKAEKELTAKETNIATFKAELTSEFKFKNKDEATAAVKVGKSEKEVTFKNDNGSTITNIGFKFKELIEVGIEFDINEICEKFQQAVENYETYLEEQEKAEKLKKFNEIWYKELLGVGEGYTEETIEFEGCNFKLIPFDIFKKQPSYDTPSLVGYYNGVEFTINYVNIARSGGWSLRNPTPEMRYSLDKWYNEKLTSSTRNYKKFDDLIKKVKELIEEYQENQDRKNKNEIEKQKRINDTLNVLKSFFENEEQKVESTTEIKYNSFSRTSYPITSYIIKKGDRSLPISIQQGEDEEPDSFILNGIGDLNYIQVLEILSIL